MAKGDRTHTNEADGEERFDESSTDIHNSQTLDELLLTENLDLETKANDSKKNDTAPPPILKESETTLELPYELFAIIAEFLTGDDALRTAANLSVANKAIRAWTTPVVYETVTMTTSSFQYRQDHKLAALGVGTGFDFIKYFIGPACSSRLQKAGTLEKYEQIIAHSMKYLACHLPRLAVAVFTGNISLGKVCSIVVIKPVTFATIGGIIPRWPTRTSAERRWWISSITILEGGELRLESSEDNQEMYRHLVLGGQPAYGTFKHHPSVGPESLLSYLTWLGHKLPASISLVIITTCSVTSNSHQAFNGCSRTSLTRFEYPDGELHLRLDLEEEEFIQFINLYMKNLSQGPACALGYPDFHIDIASSQLRMQEHHLSSRGDFQRIIEEAGAVVVSTYDFGDGIYHGRHLLFPIFLRVKKPGVDVHGTFDIEVVVAR